MLIIAKRLTQIKPFPAENLTEEIRLHFGSEEIYNMHDALTSY